MNKLSYIILCLLMCFITTPIHAQNGTLPGGLTWNLTGGTLTIDGNGAMDDFTLSGGVNPAPWVIYRNSITSVVIGNDDSSLKDTQYYPYDMVHWR